LLFSRRGGEFLNGIHLQVDRSIARTCRHMDFSLELLRTELNFYGFRRSSAQLSSAQFDRSLPGDYS
jgi:hypothetical protein